MEYSITGSGPIQLTFTDSSTLTLALDDRVLAAAIYEPEDYYKDLADNEPFAIVEYPIDFEASLAGEKISQEIFHKKLCGFLLRAIVEALARHEQKELNQGV